MTDIINMILGAFLGIAIGGSFLLVIYIFYVNPIKIGGYGMKCKICGKRFEAKKENKYEIMKKAVGFNILYDRDKILECFDCPLCGCQNIVNEREIKQEGTKGGVEENGAQTRI